MFSLSGAEFLDAVTANTSSSQPKEIQATQNPYAEIHRQVPFSGAEAGLEALKAANGYWEYYENLFKEIFGDLNSDDMPQGTDGSGFLFLYGRQRTELDPEGKKDLIDVTGGRQLFFHDKRAFMENGTQILDKLHVLAPALCLEYKIHLMTKGKYVPFVIERIARAIKADPALGECVRWFKTMDAQGEHNEAPQTDEFGLVLPQVVLYTALGKEAVVAAVRKLQQLFDDCTEEEKTEMAMPGTPRFNIQLDQLLFLANGSADMKNTYYQMHANVADYESHPEKYHQDVQTEYLGFESLSVDRKGFLTVKLELADGQTVNLFTDIPLSFVETNIPFFSNVMKTSHYELVDGKHVQSEGAQNTLVVMDYFRDELENYFKSPGVIIDPTDVQDIQTKFEWYVEKMLLEPAIKRAKSLAMTFMPDEIHRQAEILATKPNLFTFDGIFYNHNDASSVLGHIVSGEPYPPGEKERELAAAKAALAQQVN